MEYYNTRLITSIADHQGYLIIQDRDTYKMQEIEQAYKIAETNQSKYFFCGYDGLREQVELMLCRNIYLENQKYLCLL